MYMLHIDMSMYMLHIDMSMCMCMCMCGMWRSGAAGKPCHGRALFTTSASSPPRRHNRHHDGARGHASSAPLLLGCLLPGFLTAQYRDCRLGAL